MAGKSSDFDAAAFRTGIAFAMKMGMPVATHDQPKFLWEQTSHSDTPAAADGVPFSPDTVEEQTNSHAPVQVTCGIEYVDAQGQPTDLGLVTPAGVVISLLDKEYAKVKGCDFVEISGARYTYLHTEIPSALFDVAVFRMHFETVNQP